VRTHTHTSPPSASRDAHHAHSSSGSSDGDADMEDADALEGEDGAEGKKHVCPTCAKRFNRPSSLQIHVSTHTGATREFSVLLPFASCPCSPSCSFAAYHPISFHFISCLSIHRAHIPLPFISSPSLSYRY
jgi:uncharacterized Zn-finger protein